MERPLTQRIRPGTDPPNLSQYEATGGYEAARKALFTMTPQEVQKLVSDSTLRGRGGAGFATGHEMELRADGTETRPVQNISWRTLMRWSQAPSRIASCWKAIPTKWLKA